MRKLKIICSCLVVAIMLAIVGSEVMAATYLSLSMKGNITYYATDIGAQIWGVSLTGTGDEEDYTYAQPISFSAPSLTEFEAAENAGSGAVYKIYGENVDNFENIQGTIQDANLGTGQKYYIYLFMKNVASRFIIPHIEMTIPTFMQNSSASSQVFFDVTKTDVYAIKKTANAFTYLSTIDDAIATATPFQTNASLGKNDTFLAKFVLEPTEVLGGSDQINIVMNFQADIDYKSQDVLHIYQTQNLTETAWNKFGYNATLDATATKVEDSSLDSLNTKLLTQNFTLGKDDYITAPVYENIEIVNIDIATGEPILKLSESPELFEWYGGNVTLPQGTILASGRELLTEETFTVDVYTHYPDMYMRHWVASNQQWVSLSDKEFVGSVKVDGWYSATFESTLFSPKLSENGLPLYYYQGSDKTYLKDGSTLVEGTDINAHEGYTAVPVYEIAFNEYGIIPRSYVYDNGPLTSGSNAHWITNYGYQNNSGTQTVAYNASTTQQNMLNWAHNLTQAWKNANLSSVSGYLPNASLAQGENYVQYIWNWLYLMKYANNNAQLTVGEGNAYTHSLYNASGTTNFSPSKATTISATGNNAYYESAKGGSTIGVYNTSADANADYRYASNGMAYGHNYLNYLDTSSNNFLKKRGLYAHQFLTQEINGKTVLLDGYVGSNKYTSVLCLGQANPWGNVWKWVFGNAVSGIGETDNVTIKLYTTFENYDHDAKNWYVSSESTTPEILTEDYNYVQSTFNLPKASQYYRYLGTSLITGDNPLQMLVGMQTASSSTANASTGLSDYFYVTSQNSYLSSTFGVLRGGAAILTAHAGPFYFLVSNSLTTPYVSVGFRLALTP